MSLEMLPVVVLDGIFRHLSLHDLKKISVVSSDMAKKSRDFMRRFRNPVVSVDIGHQCCIKLLKLATHLKKPNFLSRFGSITIFMTDRRYVPMNCVKNCYENRDLFLPFIHREFHEIELSLVHPKYLRTGCPVVETIQNWIQNTGKCIRRLTLKLAAPVWISDVFTDCDGFSCLDFLGFCDLIESTYKDIYSLVSGCSQLKEIKARGDGDIRVLSAVSLVSRSILISVDFQRQRARDQCYSIKDLQRMVEAKPCVYHINAKFSFVELAPLYKFSFSQIIQSSFSSLCSLVLDHCSIDYFVKVLEMQKFKCFNNLHKLTIHYDFDDIDGVTYFFYNLHFSRSFPNMRQIQCVHSTVAGFHSFSMHNHLVVPPITSLNCIGLQGDFSFQSLHRLKAISGHAIQIKVEHENMFATVSKVWENAEVVLLARYWDMLFELPCQTEAFLMGIYVHELKELSRKSSNYLKHVHIVQTHPSIFDLFPNLKNLTILTDIHCKLTSTLADFRILKSFSFFRHPSFELHVVKVPPNQ